MESLSLALSAQHALEKRKQNIAEAVMQSATVRCRAF